jgi:DNA-binding LytR/AlgR family response regulator
MNFGFFFQSYPAYTDVKRQIFVCFCAGLAVFLTLNLIEPFGINQLSWHEKLNYSGLYATIATSVSLFYVVVCPMLFPKLFDEQRWVVYKEILTIATILVTISIVNLIAHHILENYPLNIKTVFLSISYTMPMAAFPVVFTISVKQHVLQKKYKQESTKLNEMIHLNQKENFILSSQNNDSALMEVPAILPNADRLVLTGTNEGEVLELEEKSFLFIKSEDNYAKVYYRSADRIQSVMLRNTLKNLEIKTGNFLHIKRCHRGYIINLSKIESVMGDSQGLKLRLGEIDATIPVGKSYLQTIKTCLDNVKNRVEFHPT